MADNRTYIRVHDGLDEHPKVESLSDAAFRLMMTTWFYSSRNRTDGRITLAAWKRRGTPRSRRELIDAGLVEQHDDHVLVHDYLEHQRSAKDIELLSSVREEKGAYGNHIRWHVVRKKPKKDCEFCQASNDPHPQSVPELSQQGSPGESSAVASTEAEAEAEDKNSRGGKSHVPSDSPQPPRFPDHCWAHRDVPVPGKCGDCGDTRRANLAAQQAAAAAPSHLRLLAQRCLVHAEPDVATCRGCAADRKAGDAA